jgi:hypothetical protein
MSRTGAVTASSAAHGSALATDPAGYERRVIGFFDRAFRPGLTPRA